LSLVPNLDQVETNSDVDFDDAAQESSSGSCNVGMVILEQKEEQKLTSSPASGLTIGIPEYSVDAKIGKSQQWRIKTKFLSRITME
jgi:hypothetical protein